MKKVIPIHGVEFTRSITVALKIKHILNKEYIYYDNIEFWTYKDYCNFIESNRTFFINSNEINKFDSIAVYTSQSHNTIEVYNIKLLISAIYIAKRLTDTYEAMEKYIENFISNWKEEFELIDKDKLKSLAIQEYHKRENEFYKNYDIKGYWGDKHINSDSWYIKLGNNKVSKDDFDRYITRGFSSELCDEYDRQFRFIPNVVKIETNNIFMNELTEILNKINEEEECSKKLKAALRLYFDVLEEISTDNLIVNYATILESLLLMRTEQNAQKIKVVVRCACIVADGQDKKRKTFIANIIACLYTYRNQIVHEGKTFLELDDELTLDRVLRATKHIIYLVIKYILKNDVKKINEIISIVKRNIKKDNLQNGQDYITFEKGKPFDIIYT